MIDEQVAILSGILIATIFGIISVKDQIKDVANNLPILQVCFIILFLGIIIRAMQCKKHPNEEPNDRKGLITAFFLSPLVIGIPILLLLDAEAWMPLIIIIFYFTLGYTSYGFAQLMIAKMKPQTENAHIFVIKEFLKKFSKAYKELLAGIAGGFVVAIFSQTITKLNFFTYLIAAIILFGLSLIFEFTID